ncbi:DUF6440 family protein [Paucilactobacillus suebicus]|uniref:DUF6440 domain-containing protein n=1 Tax=Paucilactobacillus suebicus DSM 5007 = KCTC 3549 TaxID=1423807 RepID=A0A0R1W456_9LACO|nr:hypothetical protein FD16_GL002122 [Paucilactobacillus suebicus DSM 5007 = KCTC 3549]
MAKKDKRFAVIVSEGTLSSTKILVDKQTGVHYLWHEESYSGGLTPLLDEDGKPVVDLTDFD